MNACQDSESVLFRCHNSVMPQIITLMNQAQCCVHWSYSHKGNWQQSLPGWSLHLSVLANTLEERYQCIVNEINCSSVKPNKMNWTSIKTKGVISFEKISYSQLYILPVVGFFFFQVFWWLLWEQNQSKALFFIVHEPHISKSGLSFKTGYRA